MLCYILLQQGIHGSFLCNKRMPERIFSARRATMNLRVMGNKKRK
ncbi:hypothetical protein HMPREF1547_01978 [Blautia sp. KLE 1732]|nr:hypothetical protein HMPREF1547_01978 [Blautia sp. KLE 1732]